MAGYTYDGQDVAQGSVTDAAYSAGDGTVVGVLKGIFTRLRGGQTTKANSLPVVLASNTDPVPANVSAGVAVALTTPSGTLTTGDNTLALSSAVRHIWIENNSGAVIGYAMDGAASAGSRQCPTGWARILDEPCSTAVHIFVAGSTPYNGTAGSNVVVLCWA